MFSVCLVNIVFLFPTNMRQPFFQKSKDDLFPKNTPKDDIFGIPEKNYICPRKDDIEILNGHSRTGSNDFCTFIATLLLFNHKKHQTKQKLRKKKLNIYD